MKNKLATLIGVVGSASGATATAVAFGSYYLLQTNNIYSLIYGHNEKGDLLLKFSLDKERKQKFANSEVIAIFKDKDNQEYKVKAFIDKKGQVQIDTNALPNKKQYNLTKIVDSSENKTILNSQDLIDELKETIYKPIVVSRKIDDKQKKEYIVVDLDKSNIEREVVGIFVDKATNKKYEIKTRANSLGQVSFDTSFLPNNKLFVLESILRKDPSDKKYKKVVNLENVSSSKLIVNKTAIENHSFNENGDVTLNIKATNKDLEVGQKLNALFKDQKNKIYLIEGTVDESGVLHFDTSSLDKDRKYQLERILTQEKPAKIVYSKKELNDSLKEKINIPSDIELNLNELNNPNFKVKTFKELVGKTVEATFVDSQGKEYKIASSVNSKGEINFDVNSLPTGEIYTLTSVNLTDPNNQKIVNLTKNNPKDLIINKLNSDELNDNKASNTHNQKGDLLINAKVEKQYANEQAYGIFVDKDGNAHKVVGIIDEEGNVAFDTKDLKNNSYKLDKIVSVNDENKVLIKNPELSSNQRSYFTKPGISLSQDENKNLNLTFNEPSLKDREVLVTFEDSQGNTKEILTTIDKNGNSHIKTGDNALLAEGEVYKIVKISDSQNGENLINVDSLDPESKVINKLASNNQNAKDPFVYDDNNNLFINLENLPTNSPDKDENNNTNALAIFVDENNKKYEVPFLIDPNGNAYIPTSDLPNNRTFKLETLKSNNEILLNKENIIPEATRSFSKPFYTTELKENNDSVINFKNPALINKTIEATFIDDEGKEIKLNAEINSIGNAFLNTGDDKKLPNDRIYFLKEVKDKATGEKIIQKPNFVINKNKVGTKTVDEIIKIPINKNVDGEKLTFIVKDQNGNIFEVPATFDKEDNSISIKGNVLPLVKEKIYDIVKVVDQNTNPTTIVLDKNDLNFEAQKINNTKDSGRQISIENVGVKFLNSTYSRVEIQLKDINNLNKNKNIILTIKNSANPLEIHKWVAQTDPETNKIVFDFANLKNETNYVVSDFSFESNDDSIFINKEKIQNFNFTTPSKDLENLPSWKEVEIKNNTINSALIAVDIKNYNDQPLKLKYVEIQPDGSLGEIQEIALNKEGDEFLANIPSLKANTKYKVVDITFNKENQETSLLKDKDRIYNTTFGTAQSMVELNFDEKNKENIIAFYDAKLILSYEDSDQKLQKGNPLLVKFHKQGSTLTKEVNAYVGENNKIVIEVNDLLSGEIYEFDEVLSLNQNLGTNSKIQFKFKDNINKTFQMLSEDLINQLIFTKFDSPTAEYNKGSTINIDARFGRSKADILTHKFAQLEYVNAFDETDIIKTNVVQFSEDVKRNLKFEINSNLTKSNAKYVFKNVWIGDSQQDLNEKMKVVSYFESKFQIFPTGDSKVIPSSLKLVKNNENKNEIHLSLTDPDNLFEDNIQFEIKIAPSDNLDATSTLIGVIDSSSGEKVLKISAEEFQDLNKEYLIKEINMDKRLDKIIYPLANNNQNDKIYLFDDPNAPKLGFTKEVQVENIIANLNPQNDSVPPSANIVYTISNQLINLSKKFFKAKLIGNNGEVVYSSVEKINDENKVVFNDVQNLITNRKYQVAEIYAVNSTAEFNTDKQYVLPVSPAVGKVEFTTFVGKSNVTLSKEPVTNLASAEIKLTLSSEDKVNFEHQELKVTLTKADGSLVGSPKIVNAIKESENYYIDLSFDNLDSSTEYKIAKVELVNKPNETINNLNNSDTNAFLIEPEIKFQTQKGTINFNSRPVSVINSVDNKSVVTLDLNVRGNEFNNQNIQLIYADKNNNKINSNIIKLQEGKSDYVFEVPVNIKDIKYNLESVIYGKTNTLDQKIDITNYGNSFINATEPIRFSFNKNDSEQVINERNVTLKIDFNDNNLQKVISNNSVINVSYTRKVNDDSITQIRNVPATVEINDNKIIISIDGLQPGTNYELVAIDVAQNPEKDRKPEVVFEGNKDFSTLVHRPNSFDNVETNFNNANKSANVTISLTSDRDRTWNNKSFKAIFRDNTGKEKETDIQAFPTNVPLDGRVQINLTLSNLDKNRQYTFDRLIETSQPSNPIAQGANNNGNTFITEPGNTSARLEGAITKNTSSATLKLEITTEDNFDLAHKTGTITIAKTSPVLKNDIDPIPFTIVEEKGKYYINLEINKQLDSSSTYKISNIKLDTKPTELFKNINNNTENNININSEISWSTDQGTISLKNVNSDAIALDSNKVIINADLTIVGNEFNNQKIKLIYSSSQGNLETNVQTLNENMSNYTFEITDIPKDINYTLLKIIYGTDLSSNPNELDLNSKTDSFKNPTKPIIFRFDKNAQEQIYEEEKAILKINYQDPNLGADQVIKAGTLIKVQYRKKDDVNPKAFQEVNATIENDNKISITIDGLEANTEYELGEINIDKLAGKDNKPTVDFNIINNSKVFSTLVHRPNSIKSVNLSSQNATDTENAKANVTLTLILDRKKTWLNNEFRIKYQSQNSNEEKISSTVTLTSEPNEDGEITLPTFALIDLLNNRQYTFEKIQRKQNSQSQWEDVSVSSETIFTNKSFITTAQKTTAQLSGDFNTTINTATFNLELNTQDSFDLNNLEVNVTISNVDDSNPKPAKNFTITKQTNGQNILSVSFDNLDSNHQYKVQKIKLNAKPTLTHNNINNSNENEILISNKPLIFNTKPGTIALTKTITRVVSQDENKARVNVNLAIQGNEFNNQKIRLVYQDEKGNQKLSEPLILEETKKTDYTFEVPNLEKDMNYSLVEIKYGTDENNLNKTIPLDNKAGETLQNKTKPVTFTFNKDDSKQKISEKTATLKIDFSDPNGTNDKVIKSSSKIKLQYRKAGSSDWIETTNATIDLNRNEISIAISNLEANSEYEFGDFIIEKEANKDILPTLAFSNNNKNFRTLVHRPNSISSIRTSVEQKNNQTNAKATATIVLISDRDKTWVNNQFRIQYKTQNNEVSEYKYSNEVTLGDFDDANDTGNVTLPVLETPNLLNNRQYSLIQLERKAPTDSDWTVVNVDNLTNLETNNQIITNPASTKATLVNSSISTTYNSATLKIELNTEDSFDLNNLEVSAIISDLNDANEKQAQEFTVVKDTSNNKNILTLNFANLSSNHEYKIKKLQLVNKPNLIHSNINNHANNEIVIENDPIKFQTLQGTINVTKAIVASVDQSQNKATINLNLGILGDQFNNQKVRLTYRDDKGNLKHSNLLPLDENKKDDYIFEVTGLEKDMNYTLLEIKYGNDENSLNNPINILDNQKGSALQNRSEPVVFTFNKDDSKQKISEKTATLKIDFVDSNRETVIKNNSTINVQYREADANGAWQSIPATISNNELTVSLTNLVANKTYEFGQILINQDPNKDLMPTLTFDNQENKKFTTLVHRPNSIYSVSANAQQKTTSNNANATINVKLISDRDKTWVNNQFRIQYKTQNNEVSEYKYSNEVTLNDFTDTNDTGEVNLPAFTLTDILNNRQYSFIQLETKAQGTQNWKTISTITTTNLNSSTFTINPGNTNAVEIYANKSTTYNSATLKIELNTEDSFDLNNLEVNAIISDRDDSNPKPAKSFRVVTENGKKILNLNFGALDSSHTYKIKELKIVGNKPNKINTLINSNSIINLPTQPITFTTAQGTIQLSKNISATVDRTQNSASVNVGLTIRGTEFNNQKIQLVYTNGAGGVVESDILTLEELKTNDYTFAISNLEKDMSYTLTSIKYGSSETNLNKTINATQNQKGPALVNNSETVIFTFDKNNQNNQLITENSVTLKIAFNDPNGTNDKVIDSNSTITVQYKKVGENSWRTPVNATVDTTNNQITLVINSNLDVDTEYELGNVVIAKKANKDVAPTTTFNDPRVFKTDKLNTISSINISKIEASSNAKAKAEIRLILDSDRRKSWVNNKFRIELATNDANENKVSQEVTLADFNNQNSNQVTLDTFIVDNLISNRQYSFVKLERQIPGQNNWQTVDTSSTSFNSKTFITNPGSTNATLDSSSLQTTINSASFKVIISNPDQIELLNQPVDIVISDNQDNNEEPKPSVNISEENGKLILNLTFNNLQSNYHYKLKKLKLQSKPNKAHQDINSDSTNREILIPNPITWSTQNGVIVLNSATTQSINANKDQATVNLSLSVNGSQFENKKVKLIYHKTGSTTPIESNILELHENQNSYSFTLPINERDVNYNLFQIKYGDNNNTINNNIDLNNKTHSYSANSEAVSFIFDNALNQTIGENEATLRFNFVDSNTNGNKVLKDGTQLTIPYRSKTAGGNYTNESITLNANDITNNYFELTINSLTPNTRYEFGDIVISKDNSKDLNPTSTLNANNGKVKEFSTLVHRENQFKSVNVTLEANNTRADIVVKLTSDRAKTWAGQKFRVQYTENNGTVVDSSEVSFTSSLTVNSSNGEVTLPTMNLALTSNRRYTFSKLQRQETNTQRWIDVNHTSNTSGISAANFTIYPGSTNATLVNNPQYSKTVDSLTFSIEISNPDKAAFDNSTAGTLKIAKMDNTSEKIIPFTLTQRGNQFFINLSVNGLNSSTQYKIREIKLNQKPANTQTHINNRNNILDINSQITFTTATGTIDFVSIDQNTIEANQDTNQATGNVELTINGSEFIGQKMKLVYKDKNNNLICSEPILIEANKNSYAFEINNISKDINYTFKEIQYGSQDLFDNTIAAPTNQAYNLKNLTKPITFTFDAQAHNATSENQAQLRITYNDPNSVITSNSSIQIQYQKTQPNSTNPVIVNTGITIDTNNHLITVDLSSLEAGATYQLTNILLAKEASKDFDPTVDFSNNSQSKEFRTLVHRPNAFKELSVRLTNNNTQADIVVKLTSDRAKTWVGQKFRVQYTEDDGTEVNSQEVTFEATNTPLDDGEVTLPTSVLSPNSNRRYTFNKLQRYENGAWVDVPHNNNIPGINAANFSINPANTNATIVTNPNYGSTFNSLTFSLNIQNPDKAKLESTNGIIKISKLDNTGEVSMPFTFTKTSNSYSINNVTFNNLDSNTQYKVRQIILNNKPSNTKFNINQNNIINTSPTISMQTAAGTISFDSISNNAIEANQDTNQANANLNLNINGTEFIGQKVKLIYEDSTQQTIESEEITIARDQNQYNFVFNNIPKDIVYTLKEIKYGNSNNLNQSLNVPNPNQYSLRNLTKTVQFTFENNAENQAGIGERDARLKIKFVDPNTNHPVVKTNSTIKVQYRKKTPQGQYVEISPTTIDTTNKFLIVNLTSLDPNAVYEFGNITVAKDESKKLDPTIDFSNNNQAKEFRTLTLRENQFKAINVAIASNNRQANIVVKLTSDRAKTWAGQKFRIQYMENDNTTVANSTEVTFDNNLTVDSSNGEVTLPTMNLTLTPNRRYSFSKLQRQESASSTWMDVPHTNSTPGVSAANFNIEPDVTNATLATQPAKVETYNSASFTLEISNPDKAILENMSGNAKIAKLNNTGEKIVPFTISKNNNKWLISLSISDLDSNTEYKIRELKLSQKPSNTLREVNNDSNRLIRTNPEIRFRTSPGTISFTSFSANEILANENTNQASTTANFTINGTEFIGQKVKLVYENSARQTIESELITIARNQNQYTFQINNVPKDITYTLKEIKYGANNNNINNTITVANKSQYKLKNLSKQVSFSFDKNTLANRNGIEENAATLLIDFNDPNNTNNKIIKSSATINVQYRQKNTANFLTTRAILENNKLKIVLANLNPNTIYEFGNVIINRETGKDLDPRLVFGGSKEFTTLVHRPKEFREIIYNSLDQNAKRADINIKLISDRAKTWLNHKFRLQYTENNGTIVYSSEVTFDNNTNVNNGTGEVILRNTILNLEHNRRYTFSKIQVKSPNGNWTDISHSVNTSGYDFDSKVGNTTITNLTSQAITNIETTTANLTININDADNAIEQNQEVFVKIVPKTSGAQERRIRGNVNIVNGQKQVIFNITGLNPNTLYKIGEIKLDTKPAKTRVNTNTDGIIYSGNANPEVTFKTIKEFKVATTRARWENANIIFEVDIQGKPSETRFNQVILEFKSNDQKVYYLVKNNANQNNIFTFNPDVYTANFKIDSNDLMANRNYTISKVYINDSRANQINTNPSTLALNNNIQEISFVTGANKAFATLAPSKTDIGTHWIENIATRTVDFKLNIIDYILDGTTKRAHGNTGYLERTFNTSQDLKIIFKPVGSRDDNRTFAYTVRLKKTNPAPTGTNPENGYWYIEHNLTNLDSGTTYKLDSVQFLTKPTNAYANLNRDNQNIIYRSSNSNSDITFRTLEDIPILNSITLNGVNSNTGMPQSISANINRNNANLTNKKIRLVYTDNLGNEVKSNIIQGINNNSLTFNFANLSSNRIYSFARIEYADSDNALNNTPVNNISKFRVNNQPANFIIKARKISIASTPTSSLLRWNSNGSARIKMLLNDPDNVLRGNESTKITYRKINGSDNFIDNILVVKNNNQQPYIEFDLPISEFNQEYQIRKVEFKSRPQNAVSNVGHNNGEIIFDRTIDNTDFIYQSKLKISRLVDLTPSSEWHKPENQRIMRLKVFFNASDNLNLSSKDFRIGIRNERSNQIINSIINGGIWNSTEKSFVFDLRSENGRILNSNTKYSFVDLKTNNAGNRNYVTGGSSLPLENPNMDKIIYSKAGLTRISQFRLGTQEGDVEITTQLISDDDVFETGQEINFFFRGRIGNNPNALIKKVWNVNLSDIGNSTRKVTNIQFLFDNLEEEQEYELVKVQFTRRPRPFVTTKPASEVLKYNVNSIDTDQNIDNIIYDKDNRNFNDKKVNVSSLTFIQPINEAAIPIMKANAKLIKNNSAKGGYRYRDTINKRGRDFIGQAWNTHMKIQGIEINPNYLVSSNSNIGSDIELEFKGSATIWLPPTNTIANRTKQAQNHIIKIRATKYDRATESIWFDMENLKPGYTYELTKLTINLKKKESDQVASKKKVYTIDGTNNTIRLENPSIDLGTYVAEGWGHEFLIRKGQILPNSTLNLIPGSAQRGNANMAIFTFQNGWEVGDFGHLFNYLRSEAPIGKERDLWINKLKEIVRAFFADKEFGRLVGQSVFSVPRYGEFNVIQFGEHLGTRFNVRLNTFFDNVTSNLTIMTNPILGGFRYDVDSNGFNVNGGTSSGPRSYSIMETNNTFKNKQVLPSIIDFIINRPDNVWYKES